jgi:signal transduction histidine kinase/ligand-binding sensor domain-containing protein
MQNIAGHFHRKDAEDAERKNSARSLRLCGKEYPAGRSLILTVRRFSFIIFIALLVAITSSSAENNDSPGSISNLHQWGAVTLFHGLPSNHVRAIAQDGEGIMWFGTDGGLAKYDGRRIQKIVVDALPTGRVRALKVDSDGDLWIGTDAGAARFIAGEFKPVAETEGKTITAIMLPERGRAVMASDQGTVFDCSTKTDGSLAIQTIEPRDSALLSIDAASHLPLQLTSLASIDNLLIVGTHSRGLISIEQRDVKEINSRPRAFFVEAMETDANGRLWFGAQTTSEDSGLYVNRDLLHPEKISAGLGTVNALKFDARDNLWVGTDGQGAFRYRESRRLDHFTFENTAGGLRSNRIYAVFVDREGVAWFGTDRGVCRYDPHGLRAERVSDDAESNFARALFQSSDGALWCGTNRGLFVRDNAGWQQIENLRGKTVHSIAEDPQGRLLIGTAAGLFAQAAKYSIEFSRIENGSATGDNIRAIQVFRGAVYIANFGRGIERFDGTKRALVWPTEHADSRERQVISFHAEKDERLWIGTAEAGVFSFDGQQVTTDTSLSRLRGVAVRAIDGVSNGVLWLATGRGLYALRSGELLHVIEDSDVRSVVAVSDSQKLAWCATAEGGLQKVLLDNADGAITTRIDAEQGLPSQNAFTILNARSQTGDEAIWIGTNRGVARYEPGMIAPLLFATRVMGKRIFTREEVRAGLSLEYPQNSIVLDVAATSSRTFPEQFQYSFSVFDAGGHLIRQKLSRDAQLFLENLSAGLYRVEARAFTNDLVPSEPLAFEFTVARAPFPWTSTALSVLLTLALVAVWWGYRQNSRLARTNDALKGANRQLGDTRLQLASETEAERRRIARDLHDQTLADLRRLLLLTDQLPATRDNGHAGVEPIQFRSEIESISTEIRRICEDLSPSALANVGLAAALEWALANGVAQLPDERKFDYEFDCTEGFEERLQIAHGVQIQIYRIVQEAVSNICRHAGATHVKLTVMIEPDDGLLIQLEDNGRSFDPRSRTAGTSRGLTNIRSRASLIEADASWSKRAEGGMLFTLHKSASRIQT